MGTFYLILGIFLWIILAFWPAYVAKRKGYSFVLFLILSWLLSWPIALIIALVLKDKNITAADKEADREAELILDREENKT